MVRAPCNDFAYRHIDLPARCLSTSRADAARACSFERAALPPDDTWLPWIRVERTSDGPRLTTNSQASSCQLKETNGRLDASGGKGETGFPKQGSLPRFRQRALQTPWSVALFVSTYLLLAQVVRRLLPSHCASGEVLQERSEVRSSPNPVETGCGSFDIEFEREEMPSREVGVGELRSITIGPF